MDRFDDSYLPDCHNLGGLAEEFGHENNLNLDAETDVSNNLAGLVNVDSCGGHQIVNFILQSINMEKYCDLFATFNISLDTFLNLKESDLVAIGINDSNERETILSNIESHRKDPDKHIIPEDHDHDLIIAENVFKQLDLMQKYLIILESKWIKKKFKDYEGDTPYPPTRCLQILTERSLAQCVNMSNLIYDCTDSQHLIGTILETHKMPVPKYVNTYFSSVKKRNRNKSLMRIGKIILGVTLFTVVAVKCFGKAKQTFFSST